MKCAYILLEPASSGKLDMSNGTNSSDMHDGAYKEITKGMDKTQFLFTALSRAYISIRKRCGFRD
jgi:hypothetical protein